MILTDDYDAAFAEALAWDDRRPMPFKRARTQVAYGRRLRHERRRAGGSACPRPPTRQIYRKLGGRSRAEMIVKLAKAGMAPTWPRIGGTKALRCSLLDT